MILIDSIRWMRMLNRVMGLTVAGGSIGWALLPNPAARCFGVVTSLAGLLGYFGFERLERLRATPRQFTAKQRQAFIDVVGLSPKGPIGVVASAPDQEAIDFSAQVVQLLRETGWDVRHVHDVRHPTRAGLSVGAIRTDAETDERARWLVDAFSAAGIRANRVATPIPVPSLEAITILIGPKPTE